MRGSNNARMMKLTRTALFPFLLVAAFLLTGSVWADDIVKDDGVGPRHFMLGWPEIIVLILMFLFAAALVGGVGLIVYFATRKTRP